MSRRVVVVGGGIGGLAAAWRLREQCPADDLVLVEGSARLGGAIRTIREEGLVCDLGADSLLDRPAASRLIADCGLTPEIIGVRASARRSLIVRHGRLRSVPEGFYLLAPGRWWPFLTARLVSPVGLARMALDLVLPRRPADAPEESLAQFVRRRLGREALARLAQPLVAGITTADPEQLSVAAAFPQLVAMEREHRSLILAMRRRIGVEDQAAGARYGRFISLREGMASLIERLTLRVTSAGGTIRTEAPVQALTRAGAGWRLQLPGDHLTADRVVIATGAAEAQTLLGPLLPAAAQALGEIPQASVAVVALAYATPPGGVPEAAGVVVPACEGRGLIAVTLVDRKFDHRAPPGTLLLRAFLGGALQPTSAEGTDEALVARAHDACAPLLGLTAPPRWSRVARWRARMPQFTLGHQARVARVQAALADEPQLALLCNALTGVGIGEVVAGADALAGRWRTDAVVSA